MTRQVALGAVIAFAVTVLGLSVWTPSAPVVSPPAPAAVQEAPVSAKPVLVKGDKLQLREISPAMREAVFLRATAVEAKDAGAVP